MQEREGVCVEAYLFQPRECWLYTVRIQYIIMCEVVEVCLWEGVRVRVEARQEILTTCRDLARGTAK